MPLNFTSFQRDIFAKKAHIQLFTLHSSKSIFLTAQTKSNDCNILSLPTSQTLKWRKFAKKKLEIEDEKPHKIRIKNDDSNV